MGENPIAHLFGLIADTTSGVLGIIQFLLFVYVVMGWLTHFGIVKSRDPWVIKVNDLLFRLFDPMLKKIRPKLPYTGAFDLSIIVLFIGIEVVQNFILYIDRLIFG